MENKKMDAHRVGLTLGIVAGGMHLVWMIVVALGLGQSLLNWILALHHLSNPYTVSGFSLGSAVLLVLMTAAGGYVFGMLFAWLWNWTGKK